MATKMIRVDQDLHDRATQLRKERGISQADAMNLLTGGASGEAPKQAMQRVSITPKQELQPATVTASADALEQLKGSVITEIHQVRDENRVFNAVQLAGQSEIAKGAGVAEQWRKTMLETRARLEKRGLPVEQIAEVLEEQIKTITIRSQGK